MGFVGSIPTRATMTKNRKKTETFRFNGVWGMQPVKIADLQVLIQQYEKKLADPNDPDDPKWTKHWLVRFQRELKKKEKGLALKT